jgi:hypothetical protein
MIDRRLLDHAPILLYDSRERFFAGSAAMLVGATGQDLRRADGSLIVSAPNLTLDYLRPETYADGQPVLGTDVIGHPGMSYTRAYKALGEELRAPIVYGRVVEEGPIWLQYWLFYLANSWHFAWGGWHVGDWEMIQLRLSAAGVPDIAAYAQHKSGSIRSWPNVEQLDGHPIVYVALGSHASRFERSILGDGKRESVRPAVEQLGSWALWPGRWGASRLGGPLNWSVASPTGPGTKLQWGRPSAWVERLRSKESPV